MTAITWLLFCLLFKPIAAQLLTGSCEQNHCGPNGDCVTKRETQFFCRCDEGFGGVFCEHKCPIECGQRQKCVITESRTTLCTCEDCEDDDTLFMASSICQPGFGGFNCTVVVNTLQANPCHSKPCNSGICMQYDGGFSCICDKGFTGPYCTRRADHCTDHQCDMGSECVPTDDGYFCQCPLGRTGHFCETITCDAMPGICNHGRCLDDPFKEKKFQCICDEGFEGEFCNMDVNECADKSLCNGKATCVNLHGSYRCDCPSGYTGKGCNDYADLCKFTKCENNATCVHTSYRQPVCHCLNGFVGTRCEKPCISGFGGVNCDIPLDVVVCSRNGRTCYNNGRCVKNFCICSPDFIGDRCELRRKEYTPHIRSCDTAPCQNNATCIDVKGKLGHVCQCESGFAGDKCELPIDVCESNPCLNGGECIGKDTKFICKCLQGYQGERCENMTTCSQNHCQNGGLCVISRNSTICKCRKGFSGTNCEKEEQGDRRTVLNSFCKSRNCTAKAKNGQCDEECNLVQCDFDGGDCSGGLIPFSRCPFDCADVFADGRCDFECDREECLFDGFDCLPDVAPCPLRVREHCAARFSDGICNKECDLRGCGFDGGDCEKSEQRDVLEGMKLAINMTFPRFHSFGNRFLMEMSAELNFTVKIQKDENGPMIFKWNGIKELGRVEQHQILNPFKSPNLRKSFRFGVIVHLEFEKFSHEQSKITESQTVVDLIAAKLAKTNGRSAFGISIRKAVVFPHSLMMSVANNTVYLVMLVIAIVVLVVTIVAIVVVCSRRQYKKKENKCSRPLIFEEYRPAPAEEEARTRAEQQLYEVRRAAECWAFAAPVYEETVGPPADEIDLHVQASGDSYIDDSVFDIETIKMVDSKFRRNVLHWLAGNSAGKDETTITMEANNCIELGANLHGVDLERNTPLHLAVLARRYRLTNIFLNRGADPTKRNCNGRNALHVAAYNEDEMMVKVLLANYQARAAIEQLDGNGLTALMIVANGRGSHLNEMARDLLENGARINEDGSSCEETHVVNGMTALHYAAQNGKHELVELLLTSKADINKKDKEGRTPLMLAAADGQTHIVRLLVSKKAKIFVTDLSERTALHYSRRSYHHEISNFLEYEEARKNRETALKARAMQKNKRFLASLHFTPPQTDGETSSSTSSPPPHSPPANGTEMVQLSSHSSRRAQTSSLYVNLEDSAFV